MCDSVVLYLYTYTSIHSAICEQHRHETESDQQRDHAMVSLVAAMSPMQQPVNLMQPNDYQ